MSAAHNVAHKVRGIPQHYTQAYTSRHNNNQHKPSQAVPCSPWPCKPSRIHLGAGWVSLNLLTFWVPTWSLMMPSMLSHERLVYLWINSNTCSRVSIKDCPYSMTGLN